MARGQSAWNRLVSEVQGQLPRDARPQERGRAMQRASQLWRAGQRSVRSNPAGGDGIVKLAIIGGVGYLGYQWYKSKHKQIVSLPNPDAFSR